MPPTPVDAKAAFSDVQAVATYADRTPRLVPGWADLQRMATLLLAERAPADAHVLVVGAGGGLELKAFAQAWPQWRFVGVDPSAPMLQLAAATLGPLAARAHLHHGLTDTAPPGPYDAATCLLTLHFLPRDERLHTLQQIRQRLRPGAPFVAAHLSVPQAPDERRLWLSRYAAFAVASGVAPEDAQRAAATIATSLPLLSPAEEETLYAEAGFPGIGLFYAGLAFRGWVMHA